MNTPLVSVVMPAYNAEKTIARAIDSVIGQTYRNFELIVVNDGSQDDTYHICEQYKDCRIRLFSQKNQGASMARNHALHQCRGELLTFIDSDDWYEPTFLEQLYQGLKDADLSVCGMAFHGKDVQTLNPTQKSFKYITHNAVFLQTFETGVMNSTCNKLYKRSVIQDCHIQFPIDKIGEDFLFNLEYLQQINKVNYITDVLYHYDNTHSTLTHQASEGMFQTYYKTHFLLEQMFDIELHNIVARIMYPQYCALTIRYLQNVLHGKRSSKATLQLLRIHLKHDLVRKSINEYQTCSRYDTLVWFLLKYVFLKLLLIVLRIVSSKKQ
jgi:glycosyltransferase involved in cell wall biosynthesis